ncbi:MAG: universal stress protein [Balneolales bacterium]
MKDINILVPIDFSDMSFKAFEAARELASMFGGTITPLHVAAGVWKSEGYYHPESLEIHLDYRKLEKEILARLNEISSRHVNGKYLRPGLVKPGMSSEVIMEASDAFDMIVMSSHGRTGFKRIMMGSVAEEVLRFSKVPVMVIEENSRLLPLNKILVTTDFSDSSVTAFPWALDIARAAGAEVDLSHVISFGTFLEAGMGHSVADYEKKISDENELRLQQLITEHFSDYQGKVKPRLVTTRKSVHEALSGLINSSEYNMVIMASVGHTGLNYLLVGSTTVNVVRHVHAPVLIVHPEQ